MEVCIANVNKEWSDIEKQAKFSSGLTFVNPLDCSFACKEPQSEGMNAELCQPFSSEARLDILPSNNPHPHYALTQQRSTIVIL